MNSFESLNKTFFFKKKKGITECTIPFNILNLAPAGQQRRAGLKKKKSLQSYSQIEELHVSQFFDVLRSSSF